MEKLDLIQEHYSQDPWKIMITCILLNQTNNRQVRGIIKEFFGRFPSPDSFDVTDRDEIVKMVRPTGFQNIKADRILAFSRVWLEGERNPNNFPGIGNYAKDAWKIFIDGDTDFSPSDKKLKLYLEQLQK